MKHALYKINTQNLLVTMNVGTLSRFLLWISGRTLTQLEGPFQVHCPTVLLVAGHHFILTT